jgi:hypothetical protein
MPQLPLLSSRLSTVGNLHARTRWLNYDIRCEAKNCKKLTIIMVSSNGLPKF